MGKFAEYKHSAAKTTLEKWEIDNLWGPFEAKLIPEVLSANFITLTGQLPLFILVAYFLIFEPTSQTFESLGSCPQNIVCLFGLAYLFFSICDILDGLRARRLRCGSPFGRIVDEYLDLLSMAHVTCLCLVMIRPGPSASVFFMGISYVHFHI
jgi:phosphatidylglycerophosphate synthase